MERVKQGEIALLIFKKRLREEGIRLKPSLKRDAGKEAKDLGISTEDFLEFAETMFRELLDEMFPKT